MEPPVADDTPFNPRAALAEVNAEAQAELEQKPPVDNRLWRVGGWFLLMAASAAVVVPMLMFAWQHAATWSLVNSAPLDTKQILQSDWASSNSPDYLEAVAEISLQAPTVDEANAFVAARRATQLDPTRASAWAILAYLETRQTDGKVSDVALDALTRSMDACPLCDADLIRWRFNFVLANWASMPEAIRDRAFEHADLLRWIGPNEEFLAEMRYKAGLNGIPFDAYRARVKTPARAWDIAPNAGLRGSRRAPA